MFKSAIIVGKFYPFHNGHKYLIDAASRESERVTIFLDSLPNDNPSGWNRSRILAKHYSETNVEIKYISERMPQEPKDHPNFWNIWCSLVKLNAPDVDVVFTSEDYGDKFAKQLGVIHRCVDKSRTIVPISGTLCRSDIYKNWNIIPEETKAYYRFRVCIVGPESTGKTTLAKQLTDHYSGALVEEFGREYCETRKTKELIPEDFVSIAREHKRRDDELSKNSGFIVSDTDATTTAYFYQLYSQTNENCPLLGIEMKNILECQLDYDMYLLMDTSVAWVQDGQRDFKDKREEIFQDLEKAYSFSGVPVYVLKGLNKYDAATKHIDQYLKRGYTNECRDCHEMIPVYMVHQPLWDAFGEGESYLCIYCLGNRMGRAVTPLDLTNAPCNDRFKASLVIGKEVIYGAFSKTVGD